jgi:hypothetical protein
MDVATSIGKVASADDLHRELIVDFIVIFEERNELSLNSVNRIISRMIGQAMQVNIQGSFSDGSDKQQILEIISDASVEATVKVNLNALVVSYHSCEKLEKGASFSDHNLATIRDDFNQL